MLISNSMFFSLVLPFERNATMKLHVAILCAAFALTVATSVSPRHQHSAPTRQQPLRLDRSPLSCVLFTRKIQILHPAGLRVTRRAGVVTSFGIRLYINGSQTCAFCANTTLVDPTSNQFVLYAPTAVLRPGDVLSFTVLNGYRFGGVSEFNCVDIPVVESRTTWKCPTRRGEPINLPKAEIVYDAQRTLLNNSRPIVRNTINDIDRICRNATGVVTAENADVATESALRPSKILRHIKRTRKVAKGDIGDDEETNAWTSWL